MYGTLQPVASEKSYRSTAGVPSFLDPNYKGQQQACYGNTSSTVNAETRSVQLGNSGQTRTAFYAEIVMNVRKDESSGNYDSSKHSGSLVEDGTSSSSSEDGSEYESLREVDSEANELIFESESSQVCANKPSSDRCDSCVDC
ncbi:hypothetical protein HanIR_Chr17g0895631 [Helianthus annuus]|nr:hypothetical protein HanIR_Chr17g0895631 [Helianthus annuus]